MKYIIENIDGESIVHQVLNEKQVDFFTKNMVVFKVFDNLPAGGTPSNVFWSGNQEDGIEIQPDFDLKLAKKQKKQSLKAERDSALSSLPILTDDMYILFDNKTYLFLKAWVAEELSFDKKRAWSSWVLDNGAYLENGRYEFTALSIKSSCATYEQVDEKYYTACASACLAVDSCTTIKDLSDIKLQNYL